MDYIKKLEFDIRSKFMKRNTNKQKESFRKFLVNEVENYKLIEFGNRKLHNLISSNIFESDIVLTAHYDTPKFVYSLYCLLNSILSKYVGMKLSGYIFTPFIYCGAAILLTCLNKYLILIFTIDIIISYIQLKTRICKSNVKNMIDNTSGVIALLYLIKKFDGDKKVAFIFFDSEEKGFKGSQFISRHLYKNSIMNFKDKVILNLDCVSGLTKNDILMLSPNKKAKDGSIVKLIQSNSNFSNAVILNHDNSDYKKFKKNPSVSISLCQKTKLFKQYYLPNIHSKNDTEFNGENEKTVCDLVYNSINQYFDSKDKNANRNYVCKPNCI